jgi:hypothetical protein
MKKKTVLVLLFVALLISVCSMTAFAQNKTFSFSLTTIGQGDAAWSAPNPKDDTEQRAYINVTDSNIISSDLFYFAVRTSPSRASSSTLVADYVQWTGNYSSTTGTYSPYQPANKSLYLEANTDLYAVWAEGYWYS